MMKKMIFILIGLFVFSSFVTAEEKRHGPMTIEVYVEVGTKDGQMQFTPDSFKFERGKYY